MWEERRKHELQSQTGPCICSATSQVEGIVLSPQRKISFSLFLQWLENNLSHGLTEEVTWLCSVYSKTDTVQVLGEPDILFASLRVGVRLSTGRTVFIGGKEAEVGGRRAGKFKVRISNDRNEKLKSCEVNPKRLSSLGSSSFIRPWHVLGGGRSFSGNESSWVVSTLSCSVKGWLMVLSIIWKMKRSEIWL